MSAKEYYERLTKVEQDQLDRIVMYMANSPIGIRLPKNLYNEEDAENKIYAFKPKDHRFFNFMTAGRRIIILDAYRKHSQEMMKKDLNLLKSAVHAKNDYLNSVAKGTYYDRLTQS